MATQMVQSKSSGSPKQQQKGTRRQDGGAVGVERRLRRVGAYNNQNVLYIHMMLSNKSTNKSYF